MPEINGYAGENSQVFPGRSGYGEIEIPEDEGAWQRWLDDRQEILNMRREIEKQGHSKNAKKKSKPQLVEMKKKPITSCRPDTLNHRTRGGSCKDVVVIGLPPLAPRPMKISCP